MLYLLYAYLGSIGVSYLSKNAMALYFMYRLKKDGYGYYTGGSKDFLGTQVGFMFTSLKPIINLNIPIKMIFKREELYQGFINDESVKKCIYKLKEKKEKPKVIEEVKNEVHKEPEIDQAKLQELVKNGDMNFEEFSISHDELRRLSSEEEDRRHIYRKTR